MALHTTTHSLNVFYKNLLLVNPQQQQQKVTPPQKKKIPSGNKGSNHSRHCGFFSFLFLRPYFLLCMCVCVCHMWSTYGSQGALICSYRWLGVAYMGIL